MLEINNISVCYGKNQVLKNLSQTFQKGQLYTIIGPNGCGKSTLLKAILNIIPCTNGDIKIDSKNANDLKRIEVAKKIAVLLHGKDTPDMTVEQLVLHGRFAHLKYPRSYSQKDKDIAISKMEETGVLQLKERKISTFSGGMKQNAYIAMALSQDTDYILFDEPITYLDISHQVELIKNIRLLTESGKGIITVLHDIPLALTFSDKIIVMEKGEIIMTGTPKEIYLSNIIKDVFNIESTLTDEGNYYYKY